MRIHKVGRMYKAVRITGPKHNYLGLILVTELSGPTSVTQTAIPGVNEEKTIDPAEILQAVEQGVREANEACHSDFKIELLEYVPTDSWDANAYRNMASGIVHECCSNGA